LLPGDADGLEAVVFLLVAVSGIKGATTSVKSSLLTTISDILFPWAAAEMRKDILSSLMDSNEETFATAYNTVTPALT